MENVTEVKTPFTSLMFLKKKTFLVKARKLFFILATIILISGCVEYFTNGLVIRVLLELALAGVMYNFANRCDSLLLRMKIENMIQNQLKEELTNG